jgi:hypothetical protein
MDNSNPFIEFTEVVEVEPHAAGYRQQRPSGSLRIERTESGLLFSHTADRVRIDKEQAGDLLHWLYHYLGQGATSAE